VGLSQEEEMAVLMIERHLETATDYLEEMEDNPVMARLTLFLPVLRGALREVARLLQPVDLSEPRRLSEGETA
jgi:hypothetical protein